MAACLRCDNCGATATEKDQGLQKWWTLERYGLSWVPEPGKAVPTPQQCVVSSIALALEEGEIEPDEIEEVFFQMGGSEPSVMMHFCKASCLKSWAEEAQAFDE